MSEQTIGRRVRAFFGRSSEPIRESVAPPTERTIPISEAMNLLELALQNADWRLMTWQGKQEFTRAGLRQIVELARLMALKNPTVIRGVDLQQLYVWAQGVTVSAENDDIKAVIEAFRADAQNVRTLTGHQARMEKEKDLLTDGNIFLQLFTNTATGRVRVAAIDVNEIDDIVCNPDNDGEAWFYKRVYSVTGLDGTTQQRVDLYPDCRFAPASRLRYGDVMARCGASRIVWDAPVMWWRVNPYGKFGVPEIYPALDWAKAHKIFLENLLSVWRALARFAWKLDTGKGGKNAVQAAAEKFGFAGFDQGSPAPTTASTFAKSGSADLTPIRTNGVTMAADDGRRIFLMAAMVFGFPETFYGDANVGNHATAKTLDRPTELKILNRRALWAGWYGDLHSYILMQAVKYGSLKSLATIERERIGVGASARYVERVVWKADVKPSVKTEFPSVVEHSVTERVTAIKDARLDGDGVPLETAVRMLLVELGIDDVNAVLDLWKEERENVADDDLGDLREALTAFSAELREAMNE